MISMTLSFRIVYGTFQEKNTKCSKLNFIFNSTLIRNSVAFTRDVENYRHGARQTGRQMSQTKKSYQDS